MVPGRLRAGAARAGDEARKTRRYAIIDQVQDAHDILRTDPAMSSLLMGRVAEQAVNLYMPSGASGCPRAKRLLADLRLRDRNWPCAWSASPPSPTLDKRHQVLLLILDYIMGRTATVGTTGPGESALQRVR